MPLLDVKELKMYYAIASGQVKAVDDVSFGLEKGSSLGVVGESGCGKSSLALTILRILPLNANIVSGQILLDGQDLVKLPEGVLRKSVRWRQISMVFQGAMSALNPIIKVGDQITEAITIHEDIGKDDAMDRARKLLSLVGMDPSRANSYPFELSGGMRQRAMIAMALALNPKMLIADEPTTALDVIVQAQTLKLIKGLQEKLGLSLMLISHDVAAVAEMCDKVAVMYAGKIVEYGSAFNVYKRAAHPYTVGLMKAVPNVKSKKRKLLGIAGTPPNLVQPPAGCRYHPRCPYVMDVCKERIPELEGVEQDHHAACFKVQQLQQEALR